MDFQGFQNSFPVLLAVILAFLIPFISWYSYRKYHSFSTVQRWVLISLRTLALWLILVLLLNPYYRSVKEVPVNPRIAVLMDASESLSIAKGAYNGTEDYQNVLNELQQFAPEDVQLEYYSFGSNVKPVSPDSVRLSEDYTNLFEAIDFISSSEEGFQSSILLTDGIITYGKNPVVRAGDSPFPIHAIAVGDTSQVRDISVRTITTNETGFTNTLHPVEAEISQYGFGGEEAEISLVRNDIVLVSEMLSFTNDKHIYNLSFEIPLEEAGLQSYNLEVESFAGEWIIENNQSSFSVEVLDSKTRILHLVSSIHPDVKALRTILEEDENIELSTMIYLGRNREPIKDLTGEEGDYDLLIFHGIPDVVFLNSNIPDYRETPSLLFNLPNSELSATDSNLILTSQQSADTYSISFFPEDTASDHPILEIPELDPTRLPPLNGSIRNRTDEPDALVLFGVSYQGLQTSSSLISILERGNMRRAQVTGYGWFRLMQNVNSQERDYVTALFSNLVNWTATDPDNRLLKVRPSKIEFSVNEAPVINASLLNENGEIEDEAIVEIDIRSEDLNSTFSMRNLGNGNYRLEIPALPAGSYRFTARATKGNRAIESQNGEFVVTDSSVEFADMVRNDPLLRSIAENSGGQFADYKSLSSFWDQVSEVSDLESTTEMEESFHFPVQSPYWFALVLLLLGFEWFLRKRYALP